MKKFLMLLLAVLLLFAVWGCEQAVADESTVSDPTEITEDEREMLQVGYARVDITPETSTLLKGFAGTRYASVVLEPPCATCTAVTDAQGNTMLLIAVDVLHGKFADSAKPDISKFTGVPEDRIYINGSHTHSGADVANMMYRKALLAQITKVAVQAMADRKPAQMTYGSIETENMTFTRHYTYTGTDGKPVYVFGSVGGLANGDDARHITEPDETMHLIRFTREDGKDVVMVNWRAHPLLHGGGSRYELSADFIGSFRTAVERKEDCHFIYFQGAAGNMNSITAIPGEVRTEDNNEYGAILAGYVSECLANNMQAAEGSGIKTAQGDDTKNHIPSMNAMSIGDSVAFVTAPAELFDSTSVYVEEHSPYPMTFTLGYTNDSIGYIPTAPMYEYDYEWYEIESTSYPAGTAEKVQEEFAAMLQALAAAEQEARPDAEPAAYTAEEEPAERLALYWNVYRMDYTPGYMSGYSSRTLEEDGYYHVVFAVNGKQETLLVKDKNLLQIIDFHDITGLVVDGNGVVTDAKILRECTGGMAANRSFVTGVDGNTVSCSTAAKNGIPFTLELTDQTKILDVSSVDETCGTETTLRQGDQIIALYDMNGAIGHVYVLRRADLDSSEHANHCVCGGAAEGIHGDCTAVTDWIAWGDDVTEWDCLPTESGHYYLTRDVVVSKRYFVFADKDITICLNGKRIEGYSDRFNTTTRRSTFSICDCRFTCVDGEYIYEGSIVMGFTASGSAVGGAFYVYYDAVLNLYSGTVIGEGTVHSGGLIYAGTDGVINLYNATLMGGRARNVGGNVYISKNGIVNIYGGLITGGNSTTGGCGVYLNTGTLNISGAPRIIGNTRTDVTLGEGQTITIGEGGLQEGAQIGIALKAGTGVFATGASKEDAKYFTAKNATVSWDPETGNLSIEAAAG